MTEKTRVQINPDSIFDIQVKRIAEGTTNEELKSVFERFAGVLEADVIKNYGFVHIDANAGRQKVNEIIRELNGYNLNG